MKKDDPRITAYALDELRGAERAAFEREMAEAPGSPEIEEVVREIRATGEMLREAFGVEAESEGLTETQRSAVLRGSEGEATRGVGESNVIEVGFWRRSRHRIVWTGSAAAAVLCVLFVVKQEEMLESIPGEASEDAYVARNESRSDLDPAMPAEVDRLVMERENFETRDREREVVPPAATAPDSSDVTVRIAHAEMPKASEKTPGNLSESWKLIRAKNGAAQANSDANDSIPAASHAVVDEMLKKNAPAGASDVDPLQRMRAMQAARSEESSLPAPGTPAPPAAVVTSDDSHSLEGLRADGVFSGPGVVSATAGSEERRRMADAGARARGRSEILDRIEEVRRPVASAPVSGRRGNEKYEVMVDNPFHDTAEHELPTFSVDVDTASYANVRRMIEDGFLPPRDAVRVEELINYFRYDYAAPGREHPIGVDLEVAGCPWNSAHRLVRIGLCGKNIARAKRPATNLVFLIDVSGSMRAENKLPLLKKSLRRFVNQLTEKDTVSVVVYAGATGLALNATRGSDKEAILDAMDELTAGGSTNGGAGVKLAYKVARENFLERGVNRVLLATDGDFNVGVTDDEGLVEMVAREAEGGVYLSVLGFGDGNLNDSMLEKITNDGDGNYYYVDSVKEAQKVLVREMEGTLYTVANEVKVQVDFNPLVAKSYRLLGYANRLMEKQEFANDGVDGGEIGAGQQVTALFEVAPCGTDLLTAAQIGPVSRYRQQGAAEDVTRQGKAAAERIESDELLTLKVRYQDPTSPGDASSRLIEVPLLDGGIPWEEASADFRFAASVGAFGLILRDSPYRGEAGIDDVLAWLEESEGPEERRGFEKLVRKVRNMLREK